MPPSLQEQVQTIKSQMEPKFLNYLGEILADPQQINEAVWSRQLAFIDGRYVNFSSVDKEGVFDQKGEIIPGGGDALKITFDKKRITMASYNQENLELLSFRERLILESAIYLAHTKLTRQYGPMFDTLMTEDLSLFTDFNTHFKGTSNRALAKLAPEFWDAEYERPVFLKNPGRGVMLVDSLRQELEALNEEFSHLTKPKVITIENTDLYQFPTQRLPNDGSITIPDLHGNTLKLVHFLMSHGVIAFNKTVVDPELAYQRFTQLYDEAGAVVSDYLAKQLEIRIAQRDFDSAQRRINLGQKKLRDLFESNSPASLIQTTKETLGKAEEDFRIAEETLKKAKGNYNHDTFAQSLNTIHDQFNHFLTQIEVIDPKPLVRLIGDELADRGSNDYFTLKVLKLLRQNKVEVSTLISNHGVEFIRNRVHPDTEALLNTDDSISFYGLKLLKDFNVVPEAELTTLVHETYKPTLKLLDYSLTDEGIVLFSHAPIRFDSIKHTANRLGVPYDDLNHLKLAETIENINKAFQFELDNKNESAIYDEYFGLLNHEERGALITSGAEHPAGRQPLENIQAAARHPRQRAPAPTQSPARAGLIAGAVAGSGTALIAGVFLGLILLTSIFPPVGLGLLALIGIGAGVSLLAGLIAAGLAARSQAKYNKSQSAQPTAKVSRALAGLGHPTAQAPVASLGASSTAENTTRAPAPYVENTAALTTARAPASAATPVPDIISTASSTAENTSTLTTIPTADSDDDHDHDHDHSS